ncbi:MAG: CRISPR-associated helicase Cas3', partial [Thermoanaerobacterium sp.]|nr:CRISPR-associated helicase Cas3' [Thermoanaerobacterium sp.]
MIYAKSDPVETLREHTEKVMDNYYKIKAMYGDKIQNIVEDENFWDLLEIICFYHDFGKVYTPFQNEIRKRLKMELLETEFKNDIPHGYLSPAFLDFKDINLKYGRDNYVILVQVIGFHHERDREIEDLSKFQKVLQQDLMKNIEKLNVEFGIELKNPNIKYINYMKQLVRIKERDKDYKKYVMLKGLLHRIDHSASAHVDVEIKAEASIADKTRDYITKKMNSKPRAPQDFTLKNRDKNIVMIASTGIGKTESALLWIGEEKAFFTLPVRVSINAIYKRIFDEIGYKEVGLLHSTSFDFLSKEGYNDSFEKYEISRQLSYPVSLSTIDQLFTFPFKFKGYEKLYATLAYSKVIIDEIQAYSPKIAAVILKGLQMINDMGGRFMIMTATLPRIYKEYLDQFNIDFEFACFNSDIKRHKVNVREAPIDEEVELIIEKAKKHKVLVIVNTVRKAVDLYNTIISKESVKGNIDVNLLHSLFIQRDRFEKEDRIKNYDKNGIWITTQIVEASLDIDYDVLFTELSTLDSLFQRMGRCYRRREYTLEEPNVFIYHNNSSGIGSVYDRDIFQISLIKIREYNGCLLDEKQKVDMVDEIYSKEVLKGTNYLREFNDAIKFLDSVFDYDLDKRDAQRQLREIANVKVIPVEEYENNMELFEEYYNEKDYNKKRQKLLQIKQFTMDVPFYRVKNYLAPT